MPDDNADTMPAHLQAEHAARILRVAQHRPLDEIDLWWARKCLEGALAALSEIENAAED